MKLFTPHKKTLQGMRRKKINPHRFWNVFVIVFMIGLTLTIAGMTFYFTQSVRYLDAVVLPRLDVGKRPAQKIRQRIERAEKAVIERVGVIEQEIPETPIEE